MTDHERERLQQIIAADERGGLVVPFETRADRALIQAGLVTATGDHPTVRLRPTEFAREAV